MVADHGKAGDELSESPWKGRQIARKRPEGELELG
jgi:hypothetical protein